MSLRGVIVTGLLAVAALGIPSAAANSVGPWQADNQPFGNQPVGSPTTETFTINNTDSVLHTIDPGGVQINGADQSDFSLSNDNCSGQVVLGGDSCTVDVTFNPSSLGSETARIDLSYDAGTGSATDLIDLTGTGTGGPTADTSPNTLAFGGQAVGSTSSANTETITNNGNTTLHISSVDVTSGSGVFAISADNCTGTVPAGQQCTVNVRYSPTGLGADSGTLTFTDDAADSPQQVGLTGTGTGGPTADTSPNTLAFGGQAVGSTSSANTETITNNGNTTLHISSVDVTSGSGVFAISADNCTGTVPAGQQCTVNVRYSPTGLGADSGTLTFTDDAADSPQQVGLTGTGTGAPTADTSPNTLAFGAQTLGSTSAPLTETVTNNGNVALHVSSVAVTAGGTVFAIGNDGCTGTVAAGQQCTVTVRYTPDGPGSDSGTLTLTDDAGDSPQHVSLTGSGQGPVVNVTPGSIGFGSLNTANTATRTVTVQNTGNAALTGLSISVSGGGGSFGVQSTTCGSSLAAGNQCTATVAFTPQSVGGIAGTLVVADNAADSPQDVSLTGTGTSPNMAIAPTTVAFGSLTIGKLGASQPVTVSNTGSGPLTVSTVKVAGANPGSFAITADTCAAATVAAGHSCTITLQYTPKLTGTLAGTLTVNSSVAPATVTLGGSGVAPQAVQSIRAAVGCSTSLLTWQPNDSVTGFLNTVIVRRRLRAPRTPSDGRRLAPTGAGRLHDGGLLHHSTYHYALFARYRFHVGGPVVYSKAAKNELTTQRICKPMLNQLISSHTPRVSWIAFNGALGYNLQVWLAGTKIYSPQMVPAHFTIPAGHALKANKTYTLKLYAYTKGRTRGHLLIGTSTFDT